ncbi:MAG TPA: MFS transporter [Allosphingosinicella sp.]|nr:MFS transporter [Allosphingosinicella sp.]
MTMIQRISREAATSEPVTPPPGSAWSPSPADAGEADSFTKALPKLLLLGITIGIGFTMMGSFSTVQEGAKAELALSDQSLGLVQGLSAAIPLLLLSIPIGVAVDRTHRVRLLIGLALAWTIGTALTAFAPNTGLLFAARMLTAIGTTGGLTAALSLTADYCAPALRGRGTLVVSLGQRLGIAAAFALPGWLFGRILAGALPAIGGLEPWRATHVLLALVSAVLLLPLLLLREPERHEVEAGPGAPFRVVAGELWQRRAFLIPLFAGQVSVVMADSASFIWAAPVLSREYGLSPGDFAGWMGLLVFSAGIGGAVLGGVSADLGQKSGRRGFILLGAVIAAGLGVPAALFPISGSIGLFAAALGLLVLCGTLTGLVVAVALTVLLPNELRGLCIGAFIAVAGLIGFGVAPSLVTAASAYMGGEQYLAEALALVGVATSAISFFAFALAMRRAPDDLSERS